MDLKKKKLNKAVKESLKHYDRMIAWVKTQNPADKINRLLMYDAIGEDWFDESCPICAEYAIKDNARSYLVCADCPLAMKFDYCGSLHMPNKSISKTWGINRWIFMNKAKNWDEWLTHALAMYLQIHSLLEY